MKIFGWFKKGKVAPAGAKAIPSKRETLNATGMSLGYGWCAECGDSWYWKPHDRAVWYSVGSGMTPICGQCFEELSYEAIIEHCVKLWLSWGPMDDGALRTVENFPFKHASKSLTRLKRGDDSCLDSGECDCNSCEDYAEYWQRFYESTHQAGN